MRPCALLALLAALVAGCSGSGDDETCATGRALRGDPALPDGFPSPAGVTYTATREAGPSTIVDGYRDADVGSTFGAYRSALEAAGYAITKDERQDEDAEVAFEGGGADGQVRLSACDGSTSIEITVHPA
jgi:hypothetical protein